MRVWCAVLLCAGAWLAARLPQRGRAESGTDTGSPVTVIPLGSVRGSWMTSRKGRRFEAYRNIPYAEAPIGNLRFEAPRPIANYTNEVDATEEGPICPQPNITGYPGNMDEDCLVLNVYTPRKNSSTPLSVIVYIPYGALYLLSGRSDVVGARYFMDRDVVLVTFNFRLGSLGFLSTGDKLAPGNNGFKDQVLVLRWVQKNIASFGGNPDNVLLLGCGSGSYSIALHMVSPMSEGLFHRAVSISSSPFSQVRISNNQFDLAAKQARLVGCPSGTSQAIIDCLRQKPWKEIADSVPGFIEFPTDRVLYWIVVEENDFGQERFMPYNPLEAVRSGKLHSVPCIVSQTRDEYSWLANINFSGLIVYGHSTVVLKNGTLTNMLNNEYLKYAPLAFMLPKNSEVQALALRQAYFGGKPLKNDSESLQNLGKMFGDALIGFSAHRLANLLCENSKSPVYYYVFEYVGNNSFYEDPYTNLPVGAAHHDDLIYMFSMPGVFPDVGLTGSDAQLVEKMTAIIYVFAQYGDPNRHEGLSELSQLTWPRMRPSNRSYLRISTTFSVSQNLYEDRYRVWDSLFPIAYTPGLQSSTTNFTISSLLNNVTFGLLDRFL